MGNKTNVFPAAFRKPAYSFGIPISMCNLAANFLQGGNLDADTNTLLIWFNMAIQELNSEGYSFPMTNLIPQVVSNEPTKLTTLMLPYSAIPKQLLEPYIINYIVYRTQITQGWKPPQLLDAIAKTEKFKENLLNARWIEENYQQDIRVAYNKDLINNYWKKRYN